MTFTKEHLYYSYANNNESNRGKLSALCDSVGINCLDNENFKFIEIYSCDNGDSDDFELLDTNTPDSTSRFLSSDDIDEMLHAAALEEKKPNQYESVAEDLPKKRTKVEYVKVSAPCDFFDLKSEFRSEELSFINEDGDYEVATTLVELVTGFDNMNLYRRIETPMTEREAFIDGYEKLIDGFMSDETTVADDWAGYVFDKLVN